MSFLISLQESQEKLKAQMVRMKFISSQQKHHSFNNLRKIKIRMWLLMLTYAIIERLGKERLPVEEGIESRMIRKLFFISFIRIRMKLDTGANYM